MKALKKENKLLMRILFIFIFFGSMKKKAYDVYPTNSSFFFFFLEIDVYQIHIWYFVNIVFNS